MKPKVIHLIDDQKLGGVKLAVEGLCHSSLNREFNFEIYHINLKAWKPVRYQADIICLHAAASWQKLPAMALLKLVNLGIPILYQEHHYSEGFVLHQVKTKWRFLMMLKLYYGLMNKVLAVSQAQGKWLLKLRLVSKDKLFITGQAKSLDALTSLNHHVFSWPLVIGAYGRLHHQKGFDILLRAIAAVKTDKLELRIAGSGEQELELELRALAEHDNEGDSRVTFVDEIKDVPHFLNGCDLVIIPSRWEPFGLTCQESLAAGKVVIANNIDGLTEQLINLNSANETTHQDKDVHSIVLDELTEECLEIAIRQQISSIEERQAQDVKNGFVYGLSQHQRELVAQAWPSLLLRWRELLHSV
ncbi:glycosyltransferase [Shewanella eurypsychrophilus]|uniref:Glycosyltransferase n=1 Tax=Shewanella eurypsychrophilus TaxID=2593656 RepID=A0ABX6VAG4_9GAMM|nr:MULTISPECIES: glycosyltransferase [Shewanella]QFU24307.1 glycosyltransferase [Shewanella sp. YLB-09]QPG59507.1 glycosyltransferase [Shewanella eurypsychrophilus]